MVTTDHTIKNFWVKLTVIIVKMETANPRIVNLNNNIVTFTTTKYI